MNQQTTTKNQRENSRIILLFLLPLLFLSTIGLHIASFIVSSSNQNVSSQSATGTIDVAYTGTLNVNTLNTNNMTCTQTLNVSCFGNRVTSINQVNANDFDFVSGDNNIVISGSVIVDTAENISVSMLQVNNTLQLNGATTCNAPLMASCYNIGSESTCSTGFIDSSCLPQNVVVESLTVNNELNVESGVVMGAFLQNVTNLVTDELQVTTQFVQANGTMTCATPSTGDCVDLNGYSCPMGTPLDASCIPSNLILDDTSVTNNLNVNNLVCAGQVFNSSCLDNTSVGTEIKQNGATLLRNAFDINFVGPRTSVSSPTAGEVNIGVTSPAFLTRNNLESISVQRQQSGRSGLLRSISCPSGVCFIFGTCKVAAGGVLELRVGNVPHMQATQQGLSNINVFGLFQGPATISMYLSSGVTSEGTIIVNEELFRYKLTN